MCLPFMDRDLYHFNVQSFFDLYFYILKVKQHLYVNIFGTCFLSTLLYDSCQ